MYTRNFFMHILTQKKVNTLDAGVLKKTKTNQILSIRHTVFVIMIYCCWHNRKHFFIFWRLACGCVWVFDSKTWNWMNAFKHISWVYVIRLSEVKSSLILFSIAHSFFKLSLLRNAKWNHTNIESEWRRKKHMYFTMLSKSNNVQSVQYDFFFSSKTRNKMKVCIVRDGKKKKLCGNFGTSL